MADSSTPKPSKDRQPVYGRAAVSSSNPLATHHGLTVLSRGGNAADASITVASILAVTEPTFNGIGGDFICLHADTSGEVTSFLGIGKSPAAMTPQIYKQVSQSVHTVTVPGVVAGWLDLHTQFGSGVLSMADLLAPAIALARDGFFVQRTVAFCWKEAEDSLRLVTRDGKHPYLPAPRMGERFTNPALANTLQAVAEGGRSAFYGRDSPVSNAIVQCVSDGGGVLTLDDVERHETLIVKPLSTRYAGWDVTESGNPTHGVVTLLALNILAEIPAFVDGFAKLPDAERYHYMIEAIRLAFAEGASRIGDSALGHELVSDMVTDKALAEKLALRIKSRSRHDMSDFTADGVAAYNGGTVQFAVIDSAGGTVSAVQTNYQGFGTGIVPANTGFTLQNRGLNFNVTNPSHPNYIAGAKRPYHTIMPGFMRHAESGDVTAFGVMGSFMQPQGHLLLVTALVHQVADAQQALDLSRFRVTGPFSAIEPGMEKDRVLVEDDMKDSDIVTQLESFGHECVPAKMAFFGRGHVCRRRAEDGRVEAGADCRADGVALALL